MLPEQLAKADREGADGGVIDKTNKYSQMNSGIEVVVCKIRQITSENKRLSRVLT